jgi:4-amino-4-deoxy-L-arabinose transferase-like glycosyltransferase
MAGASARVAARAPARSWAIGLPAMALTGITLLGAALRLYSLARVPGNPFYDAAVRSMTLSWHNFFFAAFEPSGRIAVDKPPVDLWLQVASVKLLGFNSLALKLPEALAGTASVPLLYDVVRRVFGRGAGLASALALAVLPVTVLTSRSDTMDTVMMLLILAAAWLVVRAAQTGRSRFLYVAAAVMGVAFNVKLLEALLPLPALALLYLIASPHRPWRRVGDLVAAALVFVALSLSWVVAVSAAPAASRPYPLGSSNGSVWNSVFVFDGTHRLGLTGRPTDARGVDAGASPARLVVRSRSDVGVRTGSELVPAFLFGGAALLLALAAAGAGDPLRRGFAVALALWLCAGFVAFSSVGRLETRYLEALTPAIAAALGIGVAAAVGSIGRVRGVRLALGAAVAAAAGYAIYISGDAPGPRLVVAAAAAAALVLLAARRAPARLPLATLCLAVALTVPVFTSVGIIRDDATAAAKGTRMPPREVAALDSYLTSHQNGARYEVATLNAWQAAPLIARAGRPVIVMTNVNRQPLIRVRALRHAVRAHELRFALLGARCRPPGRGHARLQCPPAARWARSHGQPVRIAGRHMGLYRIGG